MGSQLFRVMVTHYSQKDNHEAMEAIVLAPSEDVLIAWLDRVKLYGWLDDVTRDGDEAEWSPRELTPDEEARAIAIGLSVERKAWGITISGSKAALFRLTRGNYFEEPEDLYYGCTQYQWEAVASGADFDVLRAALGDRFVELDVDGMEGSRA